MNFQDFVNTVGMPCCILSVEKSKTKKYGEIRIVCSNEQYKKIMGPKYYDNMPYYELVPEDNKFENFCYRAALCNERMHAYVETAALNCWTDQTLIPIKSDDENFGYCQFIFEFTKTAEADRMASVSAGTSAFIIRSCITLMGTDDFKKSVDDVMEDVLKETKAEGCRIMLVDNQEEKATIFSEKNLPGIWNNKTGEDVINYKLISAWEDIIGVSNVLILNDEIDFEWLRERDPLWADSMQKHGVRNLVLLPLRRNRKILGYLYVVNFDSERIIEIKEMLELLSFFLSSEISNDMLMHKLDLMSNTDALTGLNNRNAMIKRLNELRESKKPAGVLSLDLNGLKIVNDEQGHEAGDKLLIQGAELLNKVFYHDDIFRTGGDEFIVIIKNINKETFERKVKRLRYSVEKNCDVSFAIGEYWSDGTEDFSAVFRKADARMYYDKTLCYEQHPEWKRR